MRSFTADKDERREEQVGVQGEGYDEATARAIAPIARVVPQHANNLSCHVCSQSSEPVDITKPHLNTMPAATCVVLLDLQGPIFVRLGSKTRGPFMRSTATTCPMHPSLVRHLVALEIALHFGNAAFHRRQVV